MVPGKIQTAGLALLAALLPQEALACAVCYTPDTESGLAMGLTWGLVILITSTFAIVGTLFVAVIKMERAKARAEGV